LELLSGPSMERTSSKVLASKGDAVSRALASLSSHPDQRVQAIRTLESLAENAQVRSSIIAFGGAKMLVGLLVRPNDQVLPFEKIRIANTLASLAASPPCRAVIINADSIPQLIRLLGIPEAQAAAITALLALAPQKGSRGLMATGALEVIAHSFKQADNFEEQTRLCQLLASILEGESVQERMPRVLAVVESPETVTGVIGLLSSSAEGILQAAAAVALICCDNNLRVHLMEAGALTALKKLLTHDDPAVVEQALEAIAAVVTLDRGDGQGGQSGLCATLDMEEMLSGEVALVVRQLQGATEEIRCAASHVIFRLAARGDIEIPLRAAEPLPALVSLIRVGKARTRAWAASALRLLSTTSEARETVTQSVPMEVEGREKLLAKIRTLCF